MMTISSAERRARALLPLVRFMQGILPLPVAHRFLHYSLRLLRLGKDVRREAVSADGVSCEWLIPQNVPADRVLLYLHGGGFVFGLTPPHLQMGAYLARKMGMRLLMVDYRLAPRYPFPAALDDCAAVYRWLLKGGISAQNILLAGDSAGGNLAITLLMKLRDSGEPLPAAAACLSPVTDLTKDSIHQGYNDPLLPARAVKFYNRSYVGNNEAHDPLISPIFGDLRGLPPLLLHAGEDEILCEDAIRIEALAKTTGVPVRLEIYPRMWHVWQLFPALPQAQQSLDDIAGFLLSHIGRRSP